MLSVNYTNDININEVKRMIHTDIEDRTLWLHNRAKELYTFKGILTTSGKMPKITRALEIGGEELRVIVKNFHKDLWEEFGGERLREKYTWN